MKILLVEDEIYIAEAVEQILKKNHYSVDLAFDGEYGLDCALTGIYDIIVLDIMLPKLNGIEVLKQLRQEDIETPVLLLTAKGKTAEKIQGLDSGADDYLAKPFDVDELLARLRALGRRISEFHNDGILEFDDLIFDPNMLMLKCQNEEIILTLKESQLLELLIRRKNMITSKEMMIEKVWGYDSEADDSHVENYISLLRKKLNNLTSKVSIITMRGAGYALKAEKDEK
jgi:two-component system, OmpR family, response regulator ArlR